MVIRHPSSTTEATRSILLENFRGEINIAVQQGKEIRNLSSHGMIEALYEVYRLWALPSHPMHAKYRDEGLAYLLSFIHPEAIRKFLARGLRNEAAMDSVSDLGGFNGIAVPRGIVGHWVAGNVPLLSLISVLQAILTKNVSLVKLSSKQEDWITPFLRSLAQTGPSGRKMAEAVFVVSYPGEWTEANRIIADYSDVRIAWGGLEAVHSVAALQGKSDSNTLIFGPRFSCTVIDPELMSDQDWVKLARDTVLFQQLACTSPHSIIIKGSVQARDAAAFQLSQAYGKITSKSYFQPLEAGEAVKLLEYRASVWMKGDTIIASTGTEWTIHIHDYLEPFIGHGMRIVHLYPCSDFNDIVRQLPDSIQTISHRLNKADLNSLVQASLYSGISRFVPVGETHTYDIPWDGMLVLDQLIRWIRVD